MRSRCFNRLVCPWNINWTMKNILFNIISGTRRSFVILNSLCLLHNTTLNHTFYIECKYCLCYYMSRCSQLVWHDRRNKVWRAQTDKSVEENVQTVRNSSISAHLLRRSIEVMQMMSSNLLTNVGYFNKLALIDNKNEKQLNESTVS